MEFGLLGPLVVHRGPDGVPVQRGNQRAVLAALLLSANRTVLVDELAELLWGFDQPSSAHVTVQNYVKRLRHTLGPADRTRISTQPRGYLIQVADTELDVTRFESLLARAQSASRAGDWAAAASRARAALALWRGEPLADIEADLLVQREAPRLAEMRLQAAETRIDADLRLGRPAEVIGELRQLVTASPLRERFHALLIQALAASGRSAEALAAYQDARQVLVAELGAEPGRELRELHQQILAAGGSGPPPGADGTPPGDGTAGDHEPDRPGGAGSAVPRQLPAPVQLFAGRSAELAALTALLDQGGPAGTTGPAEQSLQPADAARPERTLVISAIGGTAGVGKTALAVQWAHQVAVQFPDGQLYVNLRGYDPGQPLATAEVLASFLRALGVPSQEMPSAADERAALYRSTLAGRRVLVVLDNARDVEQVRPLLPGTAGSVVLVTSRDSLAGLVAREGAQRLDLDTLPAADALGLLRALIGGRVDAEPGPASVLASQCAMLPLALRVAAELAAARPETTLAQLAAELADYHQRLDLLEAGGDQHTAVRAVFSWSFRHLDPAAAETFWLLGLHPAAAWDAYAVAALIDSRVEQASQRMAQLARAHLVHLAGPGLFGMHDLLRSYARELAAGIDAERRQAAVGRLLDCYLHAASAAMDILFPAEKHRRPQLSAAQMQLPELGDPDAARSWLDGRLDCLVAVAEHAAAHGWHTHAIQIAATLFRYLEIGGHDAEAAAIHAHALRAAELEGDRGAQGTVHVNLGATCYRQLGFQQAQDHYVLALELCREAADKVGEARALSGLGAVALGRDQQELAESYLHQAIGLHRESGDLAGEANVRGNLGVAAMRRDAHDEAAVHLRRALKLYRQTGHQAGKARCLGALGVIDVEQNRPDLARRRLRESLALCRRLGDCMGEAYDLANLGRAEFQLGHHGDAEADLSRAITLLHDLGDVGREGTAHSELGDVLASAGRAAEARGQFELALSLATECEDAADAARAHAGLGQCHQACGDGTLAREHWQAALALYAELDPSKAEMVRAAMTAASGRSG
jgi:DNA-binding SARP family transcriptional activator/Tfp pilus assembly protein PilF